MMAIGSSGCIQFGLARIYEVAPQVLRAKHPNNTHIVNWLTYNTQAETLVASESEGHLKFQLVYKLNSCVRSPPPQIIAWQQ